MTGLRSELVRLTHDPSGKLDQIGLHFPRLRPYLVPLLSENPQSGGRKPE